MTRSDQVQALKKQLSDTFDGEPWYGESLMSKLISIRKEADQPQMLSKVASFVQHILYWRTFAIRKLLGDADFDIELNTAGDWSEVQILTFTEWDFLIEKLHLSQNQLLEVLNDKTDVDLSQLTPGKSYTTEYMIHGLIQHDVYHTGQIAVYWKQR